jgi:hypothetical protein
MFDYRGRNFRPMGHERIGMCNFYCPDKILGCLYPLINVNEFDLYGAGRVVAALDARGYKMPADLGCRKCAAGVIHGNCIPIATDIVKPTNSKKDSDVEKYEKEVDAAIKRTYGYPTKRAEAQFKGFQAAINVVSTDLTRTLALMQSQQSILLNQTTLAGTGVLSDSGSRFAGARSDHVRNMKYLAIGGGAALMAAALFKGFR